MLVFVDSGKTPEMNRSMALSFLWYEHIALSAIFIRTNEGKIYLIPIQPLKFGPRNNTISSFGLSLHNTAGWFREGTLQKLEKFEALRVKIG